MRGEGQGRAGIGRASERNLSAEGRDNLSRAAVERGERLRAAIIAKGSKVCSNCKRELELDAFYWNKKQLVSGAVRSIPVNPCRDCRSEARRSGRWKRGVLAPTLPAPRIAPPYCGVDYMTLPLPSGLSAQQHSGCVGGSLGD